MSRTKHINERTGEEFPAKTKKAFKDKKHFGFTSGTHSQFDNAPEKYKKGRTYPVKGEDYVKYGYGNGTNKENRTKGFKKEIE
jgi:hypothetical protein